MPPQAGTGDDTIRDRYRVSQLSSAAATGVRNAIEHALLDYTPRQLTDVVSFIFASEKLDPSLEELNEALADLVRSGWLRFDNRDTLARNRSRAVQMFRPFSEHEFGDLMASHIMTTPVLRSLTDILILAPNALRVTYIPHAPRRPTDRDVLEIDDWLTDNLLSVRQSGTHIEVAWLSIGDGFVEIPLEFDNESDRDVVAEHLRRGWEAHPSSGELLIVSG